MSFILDSLRKSDRNREQSDVPGLHTVHEVPVRKSAPKIRFLLPYLLVGALLLNAGAMIWWLGFGQEGDNKGEVVAGASLPPVNSASSSHTFQRSAAQPIADPVPVTREPQVKMAREVLPVAGVAKKMEARAENRIRVARRAEKPLIGRRGAEKPAVFSAGNEAAPVEPVAAVADIKADAAAKMQGSPVAGQGSTDPSIYEVWELPASVRQMLPRVSFQGVAYSSSPASRMAIINGRILREGDSFGADLRLEEVVPKGAILRFRGYLLRISSQAEE